LGRKVGGIRKTRLASVLVDFIRFLHARCQR
jgi:hypothetical protein